MTLRKPRTFYVGMVCTSAYVSATGADALVGAAAGKMSSVVSALRLTGRRAMLVSLPFVGNSSKRQRGRICRGDGFPAVFLPVYGSAILRKFVGVFTLAWFCLRWARRGDIFLFYNHSFEYILALFVLRLRGIAVFQDIEDVPTSDDSGLRGLILRTSWYLMFRLASQRKVTVSNQVGRTLGLREFIAIQGVAPPVDTIAGSRKWVDLSGGAPLRIHFGGTLTPSTGSELFCASVAQLDASPEPRLKIEFIVTGFGDLERIRQLACNIRSSELAIEVHEEVTRAKYFELIESCHASLSLKRPESEIANTTFPSKVIEISGRGICLIATQVSDVGDIFSPEEAWLLTEYNEESLSKILRQMAGQPDEVRRRAAAGQKLTQARFAPVVIGQALGSFLEQGPKPP